MALARSVHPVSLERCTDCMIDLRIARAPRNNYSERAYDCPERLRKRDMRDATHDLSRDERV